MTKEIEPVEEEGIENALAPDEEHEEENEHEESHVSLAARSLQILTILAVGTAIGLWAGPRIAPNLPKGLAPLAAWLGPQNNAPIEALEALRSETDQRLVVLEAGIKREEIETRLANFQTDIVNPLRDQMKAVSDQVAAADVTATEARLWAVESRVEGLVAELGSLTDSLGSIASEGGQISADMSASISAYRTRIDALQAQVNELAAQQGALSQSLSQVSAIAVQQVEEAQVLNEEATQTVRSSQNQAKLQTALTEISAALQTASPFAVPFARIAEVTGQPGPEALAAVSESGVAALDDLEIQFVSLAHEAIKADVASRAATDGSSSITAFFRSQVASRSLTPQTGSSADAVLSRIDPALQSGDLATVLSEADTLPEASAAVMADWLALLRARAAALTAFDAWQASLKADE